MNLNKRELELYYTEAGANEFRLIEVDEKTKEFRLRSVKDYETLDFDEETYIFISPRIMDAIILGLKSLEYVLVE